MTTPMNAQNPYFVDYKGNPVASWPPGQPMYPVPYPCPQQTITVNPQYESSMLFYQTLLKGKPRALGIVLVVSGILEIALGIASAYTAAVFSKLCGIDFWGGIIYIIAGSLTIAAESKPNILMIKGSLAFNTITAFLSFIALILVCLDLAVLDAFYTSNEFYNYEELITGGKVVLSLLLITNLLIFSVSIAVTVFGCKALSHVSNAVPQVFVIQNGVVAMPQAPQAPPYYSP